MSKDFQTWHREKSRLHAEHPRVFFHLREVWWCSLGANIGFEQDGKGEQFSRPVLILKKFNNEIGWVLPLTTREKLGMYYAPVFLGDGKKRMAILSQLRLIDAKRLYRKVGTLPLENFLAIQKAVITLISS